jgi:hypothetical protein
MSVGVMEDYKLTDLRSSHTGIKSSLFAAENGIAFFFSFFFFSFLDLCLHGRKRGARRGAKGSSCVSIHLQGSIFPAFACFMVCAREQAFDERQ